MKIKKVVFTKGSSGFYFDDQKAIKSGALHDGFVYVGEPQTPGFTQIRQAGQSISVVFLLEDGQIATGDCAAVQYSGAGGRDPLFLADDFIPFMNEHLKPKLEGMEIAPFREMTEKFCAIRVDGKPLHKAIQYGLSMALLDARAKQQFKLPCEVLCEEYGLPIIPKAVPIFGQTGDDRYDNADKMILKEVDALPHALYNSVEKLGKDGEHMLDYVKWLVRRIADLRQRVDYKPVLHFDVYGTIGQIFNNDPQKVAEYITKIAKVAGDYEVYIEGPVDVGNKKDQIKVMKAVKEHLDAMGSGAKIVADEWCNTKEDIKEFADAGACHMIQIKTPDLGGIQNIIDSVVYCKEKGVEAYQGGTCNETDNSTKMCVQIAIAAQACRFLAKPGMGFDEAFTIVNNEMQRTVAILEMKHGEEK
ncbi:MAG: methylaspartate ammonia-lyase [Candidatus Riflebacteria bacterium]|nr:methylaspartate ammonia-lyase [Candidatus Riflebacteria bacterium]